MIPRREAIIFPVYLFLWDKIALIFSGGKYERIIETIKIMTDRRTNIFRVS
jgi:hypothetical protein